MKYKILIIEPDRSIRKLISGLLSKKYEVTFTESFSDGFSVITSFNPDIIIIDPLFPKKEGFEFIKSVRELSDIPIIAISGSGTENAAVTSIESGADDFIRKPFFPSEFVARVGIATKHITILESAKGVLNTSIYKTDSLTVDLNANSVYIDNERIHLTKNEYKILSLLCKHSGKVLTYDFILKNVWGPKTDNDTGILRVNITNLRKKIEKDYKNPKYIFTENSIGYRMAENLYSPAE